MLVLNLYKVFPHDVTKAMLVSQNNSVGAELFSYLNTYFVQIYLHANGNEQKRPNES